MVVDLDKWGEHKVNMITDISVFKEVRRYRLQVMKARAKKCVMNNCFHEERCIMILADRLNCQTSVRTCVSL